MTTIIELTTSGDEREFSMAASAHADIPRGTDTRPTLIQVRAARTKDGHASADARVLSDEYTWTTILSFTGDNVRIPGMERDSIESSLAAYARELIERTVRILSF